MTFLDWKKELTKDKKRRGYLHLDESLDLDNEKNFKRVVFSLNNLKSHQFLPFIKNTKKFRRLSRNSSGHTIKRIKERDIMYASHLDSHIYSYYNYILSQKYEYFLRDMGLDENIIAYRAIKTQEDVEKGKSNVHFAQDAFEHIGNRGGSVVITLDIEDFFGTLNHLFLKQRMCQILGVPLLSNDWYKVFKSLTSYRYIEYDDFKTSTFKRLIADKYAIYKILKDFIYHNHRENGIPQGSPISGLLANMYLINFDLAIKKNFPSVFYRRYSDDLLFVCNPEERDGLMKFVDEQIDSCLLKIKKSKTSEGVFQKMSAGITYTPIKHESGDNKKRDYVGYLGFEFTGTDTLVRKGTIQRIYHRQIQQKTRRSKNSQSVVRLKPKRSKKRNRYTGRYLENSVKIIKNNKMQKQVLKITRRRNKNN